MKSFSLVFITFLVILVTAATPSIAAGIRGHYTLHNGVEVLRRMFEDEEGAIDNTDQDEVCKDSTRGPIPIGENENLNCKKIKKEDLCENEYDGKYLYESCLKSCDICEEDEFETTDAPTGDLLDMEFDTLGDPIDPLFTDAPTESPSAYPSSPLTDAPTPSPSAYPTTSPTTLPPTTIALLEVSEEPTTVEAMEILTIDFNITGVGVGNPFDPFTEAPTDSPSAYPSSTLTEAPTELPSAYPTVSPTTLAPSTIALLAVTDEPTVDVLEILNNIELGNGEGVNAESATPTISPTTPFTDEPTPSPSSFPTASPTENEFGDLFERLDDEEFFR